MQVHELIRRARTAVPACSTIVGAAAVLLVSIRAPTVSLSTAAFVSWAAWRQRRRYPLMHPGATFVASVATGAALWLALASSVVVAQLVVDFDTFVAVTTPEVVPWMSNTVSGLWRTLRGLLVAGVSASLATAAALYGLVRLRAEVFRVPQELPLSHEPQAFRSYQPRSRSRDGFHTPGATPLQASRVGGHRVVPGAPRSGAHWQRVTYASIAYAAVCILALGLGGRNSHLIHAATFLACTSYALRDASTVHRPRLTCFTIFAMMSAAVALANISGVLAVDGPQRSRYFVYTSEPHLYLASLLALANAAMPLIGFDFILHTPLGRAIGASLPTVRASFSIRTLIAACTVSSAMAIGVSLIAPAMFTETFKSLLLQAPCISIFLLSYTGTQLDKPALRRLAMLIVLVESGRAFLYSYLRSPVAYPFFAYGMGSLFASGSLRIFARKDFLPIYAGSVAYILIYGTLGATRENAPSGWAKIEYMKEYDSALSEEDRSAQQTFVSRMSNFNQLSQIGRVVEEDGFYHGGTLGYLTYAFIPRVLWPEKPLIQRGSWFAVRIGQARPTPEGWYSNTINMTQAGELYLNFGVIGTLAGLLLYGMFFGTLWIAAASHIRLNFLGLAFAYYLIWSNLGQNGDLTVVVSTVAIYLVLLATSSAVRSLSEVAKRRHAATMPHLISAWSTAGAKNGSRSMGVAPHPEGHTSKDSELMQPPSFV